MIKQNVWGLTYIDELIQTSLNDDPADLTEQVCESNYYAMQDANYNVLGMIDATGILIERYEYTPYGQRQVYTSSGLNDPLCYAPISTSKRWEISGITQPYGLNETGHQGLYHDEEINLIYNRARELHPKLSRFMQREPLGYIDGMSLYQYVKSRPCYWLDPSGFNTITMKPEIGDTGIGGGPAIPLLPLPPENFSPIGIPYMPLPPIPPLLPPSPPMTIIDLVFYNPVAKGLDTGVLVATLVIAEICATPSGVMVEIIKIIPGVVMSAPLDETNVWKIVYDAFSGQIKEVWIEK